MAELPFFPMAIDAYWADTKHLTDAEHGRYHLILYELWRAPNRRLPNDDAWLARRFARSVERVVEELRPLISEFCQSDGNWITQTRVTKEFLRAQKVTKQRREAAKSRWNKDKDKSERISGHGASRIAAAHEPTPTLTPTVKEKESKKESPPASQVPPKGGELELPGMDKPARADRGTKIDPGWKPSEDLRQFAKSLGLDPDAVTAEFVDYWKGIPGAKGRKSDWPGTFRNRCRAKAEYRGHGLAASSSTRADWN